MKRIPRAFKLNPQTGLVTPQSAFDWFAAGEGIATRKWDGIPYLIGWNDDVDSYVLYRGVRLGPNDPVPIKLVQTSDAGAIETTGWITVGTDDEGMDALASYMASGRPIEPGTYELCGPGIKGNHEGFKAPTLVKHGLISYLRCPRTLDDIIHFMIRGMDPAEGIVWRHGDQYCQLTRRDIGLDWPPER